MAESVSGWIERITFHNLDNGYCVMRVAVKGVSEPVTVVGNIPRAVAGEFLEAEGEWTVDRQFGPQFKANEIRTVPPHSKQGIIRYLGSGLVKGIGKTYAKKIVDQFGEKTLEIIDKSPTYLSQVKGIGPKRLKLIREGWQEQRAVRDIMVFLQSHGIGTARAVRIYKTYGETALERVRSNPYRLCSDIWGIGFRTADDLAHNIGIPAESPLRAKAAIKHILREATSEGHAGLPEPILIEQAIQLTGIEESRLEAAVAELHQADEIVPDLVAELESNSGSKQPTPLIYLKPLYLAELGTAHSVARLSAGRHPLPDFDAEAAISWAESRFGLRFADGQRKAVRTALTDKLLVLTGGPGTGKTTIVRAVLDIYEAKGLNVKLCAPTGRAAKRLSESTGREAKTIHRLLEFDHSAGGFSRTSDNQLDLDLLVVDETSMADLILANALLRAVPSHAAVLLVGDIDQLPSVGAGNVLADLIHSGHVGVVRLTEVHRQAGSSWIVQAAHSVNGGELPDSAPSGGDGDFYFVEVDEPAKVIGTILRMVNERIPARFGLDPIQDVQILSPMNRTELGVTNLNHCLQAALNPAGPGVREVNRYGTIFRVGDKVIQTQNNYQREVFNGDIGRICQIDPVDQVVSVDFDGRRIDYDFGDLDEVKLAYAVSIHKSQGSEYPAVVIPVHTQHFVMLKRNLLYTGITRGKRLVVLVGSSKALRIAVQRADDTGRFSRLDWRIRALLRQPTHSTRP